MDDQTCPKFEKCPIFSGEAFKRPQSKEVYKKLYCLAGPGKFQNCKRYMASEELGKPIPMNILPNSKRSIEEIRQIIMEKETNKSF